MNVEWRCKTEQSAASSSTDQWKGGEGEEGDRRGEARGEGSSRGHEELEASAKELVMVRLPSDQERKDSTQEEHKGVAAGQPAAAALEDEGELGRRRV